MKMSEVTERVENNTTLKTSIENALDNLRSTIFEIGESKRHAGFRDYKELSDYLENIKSELKSISVKLNKIKIGTLDEKIEI